MEAEALEAQPYPGDIGKKILESISKPAWQAWLKHLTMLINEYRLSSQDPKAREFLEGEMKDFLFEGQAVLNDQNVIPDSA